MAGRSMQATSDGIEEAEKRLMEMELNQTTLSDRLGVTRQPINKFFTGKTVSNEIFIKICKLLSLNWEVIAGISQPIQSPNSENTSDSNLVDINGLVQKIREAIRPSIQVQCGTMRVLDMDQPIELTGDRGIYTNVNILETLTRLRSEREILEGCGIEQFERLALGLSGRTVSGLDAVRLHRQLMVLGKDRKSVV